MLEINKKTGENLIWIGTQALIQLKQQSKNISLRAIRIFSKNSGAYLSPFKGRGMEFDESRPYQAGDDARNLDWRTMARTGKPYTKIFREERERNVMFFIDFRNNMQFATQGVFKSVLASQAAAILAWSANKQGDRIGALAFGGEQHSEIRPKQGKHALLNLVGLVSRYSQAKAMPNQAGQFNRALLRLRHVTKPGSLVFLISDFRGLEGAAEQHLGELSRHNDLVLIHIYDALEQKLPPPGMYAFTDGKQDYCINTRNYKGQRNYQQRFKDHLILLNKLCLKYRMHLISCQTHQDISQILTQEFGRKK